MSSGKKTPFCSSMKCQCVVFLLTAGSVALVVCVALLSTAVRFRRPPDMTWWKTGIVYQIYPRSFMDSDSDGVGDLRGIRDKLDYFSYLNVKAIWISPIFQSPMKDFGYDITNFTDIYDQFGNITDFQQLVDSAHKRDVKVILDFVPNHSSDQSHWFQQSLKNDSKYRDYYVWADPRGFTNDGDPIPPNNWLSVFKNSAWEWSPERQQFYYHAFLKSQPDLNYRNHDVVEEMNGVLRFWLKLGVDGFRIDALANLFEVTDLSKNEPPSNRSGYDRTQWESLVHVYTQNQMDDLSRILGGWRDVLDEFGDDDDPRFMVVEAYTSTPEERNFWYRTGADMPFNFDLVSRMNKTCGGACISDIVNSEYTDLPEGAWPNFVLGNHDNNRVSDRKGQIYVDVLNMMLLTLRGTPTTYYGEELGMRDVIVPYKDTMDPNGKQYGKSEYLKFSRDPERTPMQWTSGYMAGFTNASKPWLPITDNNNQNTYLTINVETEKNSTKSSLKLYRLLAKLREKPAFSYGVFKSAVVNDNVFSYVRSATDFPTYLIIMNFGSEESTDDYTVDPVNADKGTVVASTTNSAQAVNTTIQLKSIKLVPGEGLVIEL